MFFCHGTQKMRSDGLTRQPPVTLPPAKRKLISAPDKDKCQRADTVQATTYTCLHLPTLSVNHITTACRHSADYSTHYLHYFTIDNQHTYGKKCRVQTVLQKTVSVGFFTGIYTSAHPHICKHNAHHMHNPLRRQPICTPTHLRAQRAHTLS